MTAAAMPENAQTRLPQLSGRWVFAYRILWTGVALVAVSTMAAGLYLGSASPPVQALRLLKTLVLVSVCAILLRRRARDPVAALLSFAFLTWSITSSFDFASTALVPALLDRIRFLLFVLGLLLFPNGRWHSDWARQVAVVSVGVFLLGLAETVAIVPTHVFLPLAVLCVVAAVTILFARFRTAQAETVRQQLKWVALGLVAGIGLILAARGGSALTATTPAADAMPILWEALFQAGIVIVALGFLVSLLRYRLFDAETAITRSASYAALTVAIVIMFAGTEAAIEWFGQQYLGMSVGNLAAAVGAAVAAASLGPLHHRIADWAEHHFQRDLVKLKSELPKLLDEMSNWASVEELGKAGLVHVGEAIHTRSLALIIDGRIVVSEGVSVADFTTKSCFSRACLQLPKRMCGEIVIGPRPDGTAQAGDEMDALNAIIPELSKAIASAIYRERQRRREIRFKQSMRRKIAILSERIDRLG